MLNTIKNPNGAGIYDAGIVSEISIDENANVRITITSKTIAELSEEYPDFATELFSRLQEIVTQLSSEGASSIEIHAP